MSDERLTVLPFVPQDEEEIDEDYVENLLDKLDEIREAVESGEVTGFGYVLATPEVVVSGYQKDGGRGDLHHMHSGAHTLAYALQAALVARGEL